MSIMQVKRGSTSDWAIGKQLIDFSKLTVCGKDSTLYCYGPIIKMNVFTSSAENFSTLEASYGTSKRNGLQILHYADVAAITDVINKPHLLTVKALTNLPQDCRVCICYDGEEKAALDNTTASSVSCNIPIGHMSYFGIVVLWENTATSVPTQIDLDIRLYDTSEDASDVLHPGQLGVEYFEGGGVGLKVGPENSTHQPTSWQNIPYLAQTMAFGTEDPDPNTAAQIYFKYRTS